MSEQPWTPAADTPEPEIPDFEPITSQADFEKRIKGRLAKQAQKYSDYDELKTFAAEASTKISQLTAELDAEKFNAVRTQVAATKGVPAHRISGTTAEELEASADAYLNEVAELAKTKSRTSLKSGATATGNQLDSKDKAALLLQQMFGMGGNPI